MTHKPTEAAQNSCCGHDSHAPAPTENTCNCGCKTCRKPRYWLWILGFGLFYILTAMPVGLMLYIIKSEVGINLIRIGGYHRYVSCLSEGTKTTWP